MTDAIRHFTPEEIALNELDLAERARLCCPIRLQHDLAALRRITAANEARRKLHARVMCAYYQLAEDIEQARKEWRWPHFVVDPADIGDIRKKNQPGLDPRLCVGVRICIRQERAA